jgi:CheY-like chemotaxis protein
MLIIDDDEAVGLTLARMLEIEGHRTMRALSGEAGLELAASEKPDAIILDMRMPVMGGLEFLRRLRDDAHLRDVPVGIVTGDYFLEEPVLAELSALGATLRHKPIFIQDLTELAHELLHRPQAGA